MTTLADTLAKSHAPLIRVSFMEPDLSSSLHVVPDGIVSGNVNMDRKREIRCQAQITLANEDGIYTPLSAASLLWPGKVVKVERGALVEGLPDYRTLITGLVSKPSTTYGSSTVGFTLWSRLRLMDRQFSVPVTFNAGTSLGDIIREICELGGLGTDDALYDIDYGFRSIGVPRTFAVTDNMLHALIDFCFDNGLDGPYDTGAGVITVRPFAEPSVDDSVWTFEPGQFSLLTDLSWSLEERAPVVFNRQDVIARAPDRYPILETAKVTNPSDPLYWTPDFDIRARPYETYDIHDRATAYAVAQRLLSEQALADVPIRAKAIPIPTLTDRDIVHFAAGDLDQTARIDSLTIPLGPGQMDISAHGVRTLFA